MSDERTTSVTFRSDGGPGPGEAGVFDQSGALTATIPDLFGSLLDERSLAADLWWIAASCMAVDRNLRRPARHKWRSGQEWSRTIRASVPVQNPEWWSAHADHVEDLLEWLTADAWKLEFLRGEVLSYRKQSLDLEMSELIGEAALFSGGLDSVSGMIDDLRSSGDQLSAVSVSTNNRMHHLQSRVFHGLRSSLPRLRGLLSFTLQVHMNNTEDTVRTRGFVFLAAGVVSAIALGKDSLRLYENGPGALNLALSRGQVGAQTARAVHPKTLRYMERLAEGITRAPFSIENRCFHLTKAEMVRRVPAEHEYDKLLAETISCDTGFAHHGSGGSTHPHCGGCTSCLLRRQALAAAGRDVPTPRRRTPQRKLEHHNLMTWQVARLRHAMSEGLSWRRMVREFPDLVCDPDSFRPERRGELLDLFSRYAAEWDLPAVAAELGVQETAPLP
ncbi:7-cyano-7-deazaguanine synthase [Nocardiopsis halotolerans]|uniref:7-cyano-7-deazaguanine synthase n=1 Tax=Nocardiopsis halotolerans TaxID=124252 RepID=UPI00034D42C6|nr:7-cyano-7-deazaguanine synthase [Nocardiopsis halotolerans]